MVGLNIHNQPIHMGVIKSSNISGSEIIVESLLGGTGILIEQRLSNVQKIYPKVEYYKFYKPITQEESENYWEEYIATYDKRR